MLKYYLEKLAPWSCAKRYMIRNTEPCFMKEKAVCDACMFRKFKEFYYIGVMR